MNNPELLKCPCCGDLPEIYNWDHGYSWYRCVNPGCNYHTAIAADNNVSAIELWNAAVLKYKEDNS